MSLPIATSDSGLICNNPECGRRLLDNVYITQCSHIFCSDHPPVSKGRYGRVCVLCKDDLRDRKAVQSMNLSELTESQRAFALVGLNPEEIMELATKALNFWAYQMSLQRTLTRSDLQSVQKEKDRLADKVSCMYREMELLRKAQEELSSAYGELQNKYDHRGKVLRGLGRAVENLRRGSQLRTAQLQSQHQQQLSGSAQAKKDAIFSPQTSGQAPKLPNPVCPQNVAFHRHKARIANTDNGKPTHSRSSDYGHRQKGREGMAKTPKRHSDHDSDSSDERGMHFAGGSSDLLWGRLDAQV